MVALSLKICVRHCNVVKTMQFEPATAVYDACRIIRERVPEAQTGQASDYGLFLSDEDPRKGIWLEAGRTLDYYMLRNGDILEYKKKQRPQKIRMLDGSVKTVMVDDSKTVGELLVTICSRIGITNYEEYSLIQETMEEKKEEGTGTLKKDRTLLRDERKMEKLKAKLHTDDDLNWLDHSRTFREQGVDENETLLLRRKFFYSDQNVDSRDPVQLNLLYVQARDDILNGSHPVSFEKACEFGGFQAQIQFGPHVDHKHKPGFLDLKEFLPKEYIKQRGAEKRIFQVSDMCRSYSFPHSLASFISMRGPSADDGHDFGEYQESYYSVQTTEGEQISQLIAGYIDIILKKLASTTDIVTPDVSTRSTPYGWLLPSDQDPFPRRSTILQQQFNRTGKVEHGSVALPAVMRSGSSGPETFNVGSMPSPQQQVTVGQMHRGHMPPLTSAQQALMGTINTSMHAVQQAQDDLSELDSLPPLGQDMASRVWVQNKVDESKHEIHSQVDAITAGTASVVNLTAGDPADTDYTAVGCAITTISSNLTEMSKGVKLLAAFMDDEVGSGEDLLRAARTLAGAVSDLLKAVQPTSGEPRQTVLTAAGSIGQASGDLLRQIGENETDERFQVRYLPRCGLGRGSKRCAMERLFRDSSSSMPGTYVVCPLAVADHIPQLVQGVRGSQAQAEDLSAQLVLIISSQNFLQPGSKMVSSAKAAVPTVSDQAAAMQLSQCAKNLATSLAELRTASQKAHEACGPMEIDSALNTVQTLKNELQDAKMAATESQLKPLPGETLEKCAQDLGSTSKAVGSSMAQLLTCAAQGNEHYTGVAARETAQALKILAQAARGVAASTSDPSAAHAMLDSARDVMEGSAMLIQEAKQALIAPGDAESQQRLAQVAKAVSHSLNNCVNCLPGQKDVDVALKSIGESSKKLLVDSLPPSTKPFQEAQSELNQAAADLNQSAGEVVHATRGQSGELAAASGKFSDDFDEFLDAGIEMAGQAQTKEDQIQVIGNLKNISMASSKLLLAAKSLSVDPGAPNAKNLLAAAARAVTESINQLITLCTQQAPGQKECDNALRELETVKGMLDNPNEPVSDLSYFDCIESVMENSKVLGESMAGISQNAKTGDLPAFGECVGVASKALCGLTEAAAQVLSAATIVAKHTSALCNACRIASSKTANPVAKRHFVQSAKEVANSTANLVKTIKALDGDFSEDNRNKCRIATAPLIEAVENLTAFASNPEFVSVPAQISSEGSQAQEPILVSAKTMLESSSYLIRTARSLAINPKDPPTWSVLAGHSHTVSDSIKSLITSIRDKAPGQRECDISIDGINRCIRDIEQASLAAVSQSLATRDDISVEALQEQLTSVVQEIGHLIDPITTAARGEAAQLGHKVTQLASYFEPLILAAVGVASKILDHQQQMTVLDQTKTLAESALQMLYAAKEGGGNPKAQHTHDAIMEAAQLMKEAVDDIMVTLNEAASEVGLVGGMVDAIAEAMSKLDEGSPPEPKGTFVDYQTTVVKYSKAIAVTAQEMMTKSVTNPEELGGLASQMTSDYGHLALQGQLAAATAEPEEIGFQIRTRVQDLGHGCIFLVQKAGALQVCPTDSYTKRELIECARAVTEKVSLVLSALQAGNKGTQACITAATAVSGIIADLDTTIMFATAGTLNAENNETFADHRENILKTAKALVEDTKLLVSGAASTPDKLAQAAQSSAATITQLAEVVKLGAASLGSDDPETQVVLINAIKDVAKALSDLIGATKGAASKPADDPSMYQLKGAAKVMVTNVTSLLKTVKAVEDEATRGTRALEATIEYIKQELTVFQSKEVPEKTSSPEESIRMTKGITMATAKAVAAGNSCRQEDVIATANLSRKAVSDMLTACKQASFHPDVSEEVRTRALRFGTECTLGYLDLLEHVLVILQKPTPELKHQLSAFSKRVAGAVTELIQAAEAMKGTEWVDPEDPTVIAETELLGAAASIEAAAKKLEQLKPRAKPKQADETLDFEEQILEAAKSIAAATSALVKSASAAQRELVAQGKVGSIPANAADDGQWSQGLISAARMVAAATSNLCEAANASVQGHASEEKLISSAKQVAASTAQLLVACKVKADQDSEAMRRLQAAGNAVKRASDSLVRAAQQAAFGKADDDDVVVKTKFVGGIAQIIAAQEEMLKKERELEEARKKLAQIRQQQYKFLPTELREDEG
ncbi:talin-2 [Trichechus manatus latirostris]|uniref:Talin-2 n=1 Tax=Trichechus manatus latirostris TaxID=127582 RepID=A0A2Y9R1Z3_TRIMA|nr:talin-2 [Trichechus manatus latirostris]